VQGGAAIYGGVYMSSAKVSVALLAAAVCWGDHSSINPGSSQVSLPGTSHSLCPSKWISGPHGDHKLPLCLPFLSSHPAYSLSILSSLLFVSCILSQFYLLRFCFSFSTLSITFLLTVSLICFARPWLSLSSVFLIVQRITKGREKKGAS